MTEVAKDLFNSVAISMRVEGQPSFMLLVTRAGMIRRMGFSDLDDEELTVADGHEDDLFDQFMAEVPEELLSRGGTYEADGTEGKRCDCRIEFAGETEPVNFELVYYSRSAGLPKAISDLIATGERLTDEWYAERIGRDTTVEESEGSPKQDPDSDVPPSPTADHPSASKQRIALAVLLDFFVFRIPYAFLRLLFFSDGGEPLGLGLVIFAFVEFCLLQFVRMSPGYWLLGITAALGEFPKVDPELRFRESLVTHVMGVVFLGSGIDGLLSWAVYEVPIPYFGLPLGPVLSALFSLLIGAAFVVAGVLIFRADLRGVWAGAGVTAFSFLSVWFARGQDLDGWVAAELAARRALEGRPVDPAGLETAVSFVGPLVLIVPVLYGIGVFFTWKRLRPPEDSPPVV